MAGEQSESGTDRLPEVPNALLSIKPEYADAILDGSKQYEYRRVVPSRGPPMRLVLYASSPVQAAVGGAWSWTVREDSPDALIDDTVRHTPHDAEDVREYFDGADTGHAIRIGAYSRFDESVPRRVLKSMDLKPSQNFRYAGTVTADPERVEPGIVTAADGGTNRSLHTDTDDGGQADG